MGSLGAHSWIFDGIANAMALFVLGRLLIFSYREHSYLYQLESGAKTLDAWIEVARPFVSRLALGRYRSSVARKLSRAAIRRDWGPDHFIASQVVLGLGALVGGFVVLYLLLRVPLYLVVAFAACMAIFPYLKLTDVAARRYAAVNRDLPYFIDYMSLAMGAGLDFNQALAVVVQDSPQSPLADEFSYVLRNLRLGMSRAEALTDLERRMASPSVKLFVQTLVQGMELGTDVVQTLTAMSDNLQQKRFQKAEEAAGKISVKMMIPMMCFVMPAVMIVLFGPMVLSSMMAG